MHPNRTTGRRAAATSAVLWLAIAACTADQPPTITAGTDAELARSIAEVGAALPVGSQGDYRRAIRALIAEEARRDVAARAAGEPRTQWLPRALDGKTAAEVVALAEVVEREAVEARRAELERREAEAAEAAQEFADVAAGVLAPHE